MFGYGQKNTVICITESVLQIDAWRPKLERTTTTIVSSSS